MIDLVFGSYRPVVLIPQHKWLTFSRVEKGPSIHAIGVTRYVKGKVDLTVA